MARALAADERASPHHAPPPGLTLRLTALRAHYVLEDRGVSLRKQLIAAAQAQADDDAAVARATTRRERLERQLHTVGRAGHSVQPQAVELAAEIVNDTREAIELWDNRGDRDELRFTLRGPCAIVRYPRGFSTPEFRLSPPVRIQPGQAHRIPISRLISGKRRREWAYFACPGRYTLVATLVTGRRTGPAGVMGDEDAYATVVLTSNVVTFDVEGPPPRPADLRR